MTHPSYALLYVADPAASATFYADLFDTRPVDVSPAFALFALEGGMMLGLWAQSVVVPAPSAAPGASELGIRMADDAAVDAAFADWQARGVTIAAAPMKQGFGYSFMGLDPDGHRLRVYALAGG